MTASAPIARRRLATMTIRRTRLLLPHDLRGDVRGPAEAVADRSELDAGDLIEETLRDLPDRAVADLDRRAALEQQLADADDRRRRSGRKRLSDDTGADLLGDLVDVDVGLARRDAEVAGEHDETVARDAWEDRAAQLRRDQLAVADEEDVHPAELLDAVAADG